MATDIVSEFPPSPKRHRSNPPSAPSRSRLPGLPDDPALRDDPAVIVGLALASSRQACGDMASIPSVLLDRLDGHARKGDAACRTVLDHVTRNTSRCSRVLVCNDAQPALDRKTGAAIIAAPIAVTSEGK